MQTDLEWLVSRLDLILNFGASQKDTLEKIKELTEVLKAELEIGRTTV
jgi:hypothetical protein